MFDSPIRFCVQAEARSHAIKDLQNYLTSALARDVPTLLINLHLGAAWVSVRPHICY